jgi:hypothetical protein
LRSKRLIRWNRRRQSGLYYQYLQRQRE